MNKAGLRENTRRVGYEDRNWSKFAEAGIREKGNEELKYEDRNWNTPVRAGRHRERTGRLE